MSAECPLCHVVLETILHLFRDCPKVVPIWRLVLVRAPAPSFFSQDLCHWFASNLQVARGTGAVVQPHTFVTVLWAVWRMRNKVVF